MTQIETTDGHRGSSPGSVRMLNIGPDRAGQRIDNFLATQLKGVPKSHIYRILRRGEVRVNKGRIRPHYRLCDGDVVRIPPLRTASPKGLPEPGGWLLERLQAGILYEDKGLLVLDKPAGVAVHGGSGVSLGLIEALRKARPDARFLELVHRLDRDTSGCLLVAKRRSMLRHLHEQIRANRVGKKYLALVRGDWREGDLEVDAPLLKNRLKSGERIVRVDPQGKPARTRMRLLRRLRGASLMEVVLLTGRTHQIRVHAAHIDRPIAGDEKYGDPVFDRVLRDAGLKRLFLHAHSLSLTLPDQDKPLRIQAPLDPALEQVLANLSNSPVGSQAGQGPLPIQNSKFKIQN